MTNGLSLVIGWSFSSPSLAATPERSRKTAFRPELRG
jgi:hypothetical protein